MATKLPVDFKPVPLRPRHDGWTAQKQIAFIEALAETACVEEACRRVGMSDSAAYRLRRRSCGKQFRLAWDAALDYGLHRLEQAAMSRALNGVVRPVFHKGEQVGEWRAYDERLTMFLLRNRRPARYGRWIERMPAPEPDFTGEIPTADESAEVLGVELIEVGEYAPEADGNPLTDWPFDSHARVEE